LLDVFVETREGQPIGFDAAPGRDFVDRLDDEGDQRLWVMSADFGATGLAVTAPALHSAASSNSWASINASIIFSIFGETALRSAGPAADRPNGGAGRADRSGRHCRAGRGASRRRSCDNRPIRHR